MIPFFLQFQIFVLLLWPVNALAQAPGLSANCSSICGNVTIPFPFGIEDGCAIDSWHKVNCTDNKPYIGSINTELLDISLDGTMRVSYSVFNFCSSPNQDFGSSLRVLSPYVISPTRNKFIGIGNCKNFSLLSNEDSVIVHCSTTCNDYNNTREVVDSCQEEVLSTLKTFTPTINAFKPTKGEKCPYVALVDQQWLKDNIKNSQDIKYLTHVPVVMEWSVFTLYFDNFEKNNLKADDSKYTCERSYCSCFSDKYPTVGCKCFPGFEGNPYLPKGCQDINECKSNASICGLGKYCENFEGGYNCFSSPRPSTKLKVEMIIIIGLSAGFGSLFLLIGAFWLCIMIKRRNEIKLKEKYFKKNGGLLLQQQLTSFDGDFDKSKLLSSKELDKATDHFNVNRILGQGGQGTVYKGMLTDGKLVAVKKSKVVDKAKLQEFINEVVILSQINHRNIVKLLGFCLETEVPLLVYEFIHNGTLFSYLQEQNEELPFTWDMRLRIATEIAGAIFYLHSAASLSIYHRDIKSSNILLDEKYRAKVADFGTSRSIPVDYTHVTTKVQGTFGYLDPEYFRSNQFTDKSDVYSFGVVLVELLTGKKPIFSTAAEEGKSLASYFISSMEENNLHNILDVQVKLGKEEEIMAMANLAIRCLNLHGKQRPTMKEVAMVLEGIRAPNRSDIVQGNVENFAYEGLELTEPWDGPTSTSSTFDSITRSIDAEPLLIYRSH